MPITTRTVPNTATRATPAPGHTRPATVGRHRATLDLSRLASDSGLAGHRTVGMEAEYGRLYVHTVEDLQDHQRVFHTDRMVYDFETQGEGARNRGIIEAKSKRPIDLLEEPGGLQFHADEVKSLYSAMTARRGKRPLAEVLDRFAAAPAAGRMAEPIVADGIVDAAPRVTNKGKNRVSPQITVTHWLRNLNQEFSKGYPMVPTSSKNQKAYRDTLLRDAAADANALYGRIVAAEAKRSLATGEANLAQKKHSAETRRGDKIRGFLAMLAQDYKVVSSKVRQDLYVSNDGREINPTGGKKQWSKDYFGLLSKTPTGLVFSEGLSDRDRALLRNHQALVRDAMVEQAMRGSEKAAKLTSIRNGKLFWSADEGTTVETYVDRIFAAPEVGDTEAYAAFKQGCEDDWHQIIGDMKSEPIYQHDTITQPDGSQRLELRPAFEYRQLDVSILDDVSVLFNGFRDEGASYLARHPAMAAELDRQYPEPLRLVFPTEITADDTVGADTVYLDGTITEIEPGPVVHTLRERTRTATPLTRPDVGTRPATARPAVTAAGARTVTRTPTIDHPALEQLLATGGALPTARREMAVPVDHTPMARTLTGGARRTPPIGATARVTATPWFAPEEPRRVGPERMDSERPEVRDVRPARRRQGWLRRLLACATCTSGGEESVVD